MESIAEYTSDGPVSPSAPPCSFRGRHLQAPPASSACRALPQALSCERVDPDPLATWILGT